MFPLHTKIFPSSASELARLLNESLSHVLICERAPVSVRDRSYPALETIEVSLDRARVRPDALRPPRMLEGTSSALQVERMHVSAQALSVGPAHVDLTLNAREVRLNQGQDAKGDIMLGLESAVDGRIELSTAKSDLEAAIAEAARREAGKHGVGIEDVQLTVRSLGARAVEGEVSFRARKLFLSASIRIAAKLAIDDQLNARISGLCCKGEGALGALACGVLGPRLQKLEGRTFALMALPPGQIRLRDVRLAATGKLSVRADFSA